jgi:hypothetical protein
VVLAPGISHTSLKDNSFDVNAVSKGNAIVHAVKYKKMEMFPNAVLTLPLIAAAIAGKKLMKIC